MMLSLKRKEDEKKEKFDSIENEENAFR